MQIPKGMVVERIRTSGDVAMADRAEAELPEKIDTERDAELLRKFNLDPQQLADGLGGQAPAIGRSTLLDAELCCALSRSAPAVIPSVAGGHRFHQRRGPKVRRPAHRENALELRRPRTIARRASAPAARRIRVPRLGLGRPRTRPDQVLGDKTSHAIKVSCGLLGGD
jgi:hypothetical protein